MHKMLNYIVIKLTIYGKVKVTKNILGGYLNGRCTENRKTLLCR